MAKNPEDDRPAGKALAVDHGEISAYPALPPDGAGWLADLMTRLTGQAPPATPSAPTDSSTVALMP